MKARQLTIGGKIALTHLGVLCAWVVFTRCFSQPDTSYANTGHWFWSYVQVTDAISYILILPLVAILPAVFESPWTSLWEIPLLLLAIPANSFIIGYGTQGVLTLVRKARCGIHREPIQRET